MNTNVRIDGRWERRSQTTAMHRTAVEHSVVHMRRNLAESLNLAALSRVASLSKFHFVRVFEEITGTTPCHFLGCLRIQKAKELLLSTDSSVTDICMEVGYSSLGSFSTAFSELVGLTPSAYRRWKSNSPCERILERIATSLHAQKQQQATSLLSGCITAPRGTHGIIFVGTFDQGVPHGVPTSGTVLLSPGEFQIAAPAAKTFHLLATLLPYGIAEAVPDSDVSGTLVASSRVSSSTLEGRRLPSMALRPVELTDPPLLIELTALV